MYICTCSCIHVHVYMAVSASYIVWLEKMLDYMCVICMSLQIDANVCTFEGSHYTVFCDRHVYTLCMCVSYVHVRNMSLH